MWIDDINPDDALSPDELKEKIKQQEFELEVLKVHSDYLAENLTIQLEMAKPYQAELGLIDEAINDLYAKKSALKKEIYALGMGSNAIIGKKSENKASINDKTKYIAELKAALHKANKENEKYTALAEKGEELSLRAKNFPWFEAIKGYQLEGAKQMALMHKVINADEMGLGKSLQALAAADLAGAKKVLIISKIDIVTNFANEVEKWCPHRKMVFSLPGYKKSFQKHYLKNVLPLMPEFVVLLNFETWWSDPEILSLIVDLQFDTVIFDEAHNAKERTGKTASGFRKFINAKNKCKSCGNREIRFEAFDVFKCVKCHEIHGPDEGRSIVNIWPMTGSPILNRPDEVWPMLNFIDPKQFGDHQTFLRSYCAQEEYYNLRGNRAVRWTFRHGGSDKLLRSIGPQFIRRTKKQAGIDLPPNHVQIKNVPFDKEKYPAQYKAYHDLLEYFGALFDEGDEATVIAKTGSTIVGRLRQITSWPAGIKIYERDQDSGEKNLVWQCDVQESAKMDAAIEDIVDHFERGERVVVFAKHVAVLEEVKRRLDTYEDEELERRIRSCLYYGKTSLYDRERIKRDFDISRTNPDKANWDVVICQNEAASQGLNFNGAQHMVVMERLWGPKLEEQQFARTNRMGQNRNTTVTIIQVDDTIDRDVEDLLYRKREDVDRFEESSDVVQRLIDRLFRKATEESMGGM